MAPCSFCSYSWFDRTVEVKAISSVQGFFSSNIFVFSKAFQVKQSLHYLKTQIFFLHSGVSTNAPSQQFYFINSIAANTSFIITLPRLTSLFQLAFVFSEFWFPSVCETLLHYDARLRSLWSRVGHKAFFVNLFGVKYRRVICEMELSWKRVYLFAKFACFEQLSFRFSLKKSPSTSIDGVSVNCSIFFIVNEHLWAGLNFKPMKRLMDRSLQYFYSPNDFPFFSINQPHSMDYLRNKRWSVVPSRVVRFFYNGNKSVAWQLIRALMCIRTL